MKIDKNNKTLLDLWTKSLSEPDTSQETKRGNMSLPVIHTGIGQQGNNCKTNIFRKENCI